MAVSLSGKVTQVKVVVRHQHSGRPLLRRYFAITSDVEKYLLEVPSPVAGNELVRAALVHQTPALEHQHLVCEALDLGHLVGGKQYGGRSLPLVDLKQAAELVGRV